MSDAATRDLPDRLDAAILEHLEAVDRGETLDPQLLLARYPDVAAQLRSFFETARAVEAMAGPTAAESVVMAQGVDTSRLADTWNPASPPAPPPDLLPAPGRFGRYQILRKLGQGAMGVVYLAHDTQLSRQVALKVPVFDETAAPEMIDRFYREARATANVRSPNLCPIYDVDQIDGIHFIAMAYIEGRSLSRWAREVGASPREIAAVMRKVALAMQKAHDQHVIHRDLKPGNIMIDGEGEPVVMDFGLARIGGGDIRDTKAGTIIGSPAYMAPEQVAGREVGPAVDVYALGVALFELLAGRLPYQGSVISVIGQILAADAPTLIQVCPGADSRLNEICRRMMAKNVADRFASMDEVAAALTAYLDDAPGSGPLPAVEAEVLPGPHMPAPQQAANSAAAVPATRPQRVPGARSIAAAALVITAILALAGLLVTTGGFLFLQALSNDAETETAQRREPPADEGGDGRKPPPPADAEKTAGASSDDGESSAQPRMRYRWEKGQTFGYDLTLEARQGSARETLKGTLIYEVVEADKKRFKLRFDSRLSSTESSSLPGPAHIFRSGPYPPLSDVVGMFPAHELTVDASGRVVESQCRTELPYTLGPLSQLLIEPLPDGRDERWTTRRGTAIRLAADRFRGPPRGFGGRAAANDLLPATASLTYEIESLEASQVKIVKRFSVSTNGAASARTGSSSAFTGSGEFVFDRRQGLVTTSRMTLRSAGMSSGRVEVSLRCRLLYDDELAERTNAASPNNGSLSPFESKHLKALMQPPDPAPGRAVTAETRLKAGDRLQVYRMGRWYDARVVEVLADGRCRVQLIGYGAESAEAAPRHRLRILPAAAREE